MRLHKVVFHLMVNHYGLRQLLALESRLRIPPVHKLLLIINHFHENVLVIWVGLSSQFSDRAKSGKLPYWILQSCKRLLSAIRVVLLLKFHLSVLRGTPQVCSCAWVGGLLIIIVGLELL